MNSLFDHSGFVSNLPIVNGKYELVEIIGEGTYGEVYRGKDKKHQMAAIKVVENNSTKLDELVNEISIFQRFSNHPNMVDYFGTYAFKNPKGQLSHIWLVMEYCEGRSVAELSKTMVQNGNNLSESVIKYILHQTLQGIVFLHKSHVIHRDIKGPNILLTIQGHVKLIDYGVSAQLLNTMARRHSSVGSPFWMAPEVIACEHQLDYTYNNRCDVWSLGITAIELADGDPPFAEEHPMRALFKIPRNPPPTVRNPKKWSQEFLTFISKLLVKDYEVRPSSEEVLKEPFLQECNDNEKELRKELMAILHIIVQQYNQNSTSEGSGSLDAKKRNAKKNSKMLDLHDLATLPRLTDEILLSYINGRYIADQIYTYIGEILIAVNPYKDLGIYGDGAQLLYQDSKKDALPPHVFMIACNTHQAMVQKQNDQCCVISGESGSGKTMTSNFLIKQLAFIGKSNTDQGVNLKLVKKILQVTPLMEAFGNAQTIINQNSSRFGKFLELHFTETGRLVGGQLSEFLLEKSRVVSQPFGERNFHIMYYMIAGLDFHNKLKDFELSTISSHRYLNTDELTLAECACTSEYQVRFNQVQKCLEDIGFTPKEIQSLYCILAAITHLGDVNFTIDDFSSYEGEKAKVVNGYVLDTVSSLLCLKKNVLNEALITSTHVARGETIKKNNTMEQAMDCRDATAKALYGRLFSWIVKRINILLRAEDKTENRHSKIGILDIFGFENLKTNSFEQLCINIANEQLQFYFNEYIFVWEFDEYASEDIKAIPFEFKNNKEILDLFLQKPVGLLALLDEESRFPMATDMTLVEKFHDNIESPYMKTTKDASTIFGVKHYAEQVSYDTTGFLEKNRDTLSPGVIETLQSSTDETIGKLFRESANDQSNSFKMEQKRSSMATTNRLQQTVSSHFRLSLRSLISKIIKSDPNFVRCIRPNIQNEPGLFDEDKVMQQLKYTGILETTKIRKQGYSDRIPFQVFVNRYKFLLFNEAEEINGNPDICVNLLRQAKIDEEETWKIGKTKVFLKYWHVQGLQLIWQEYLKKIIKCQGAYRAYIMRKSMKQFARTRHNAASKIRAQWMAYMAKKRYQQMLQDIKDEQERMRRNASSLNDDKDVRPFYKNMKRHETAYLQEAEETFGGMKLTNVKREIVSDMKKQKKTEEEMEGEAALEETKSIILLLQIELACKEVCDMLFRTAYPVIHSSRAKTAQADASGPKMKVQRLNHREKQLAVVDGYGDPLDQTFRHAKLHHGEVDFIEKEKDDNFQNEQMLGLVEKPLKEHSSNVSNDKRSDSIKSNKGKPNEKPKTQNKEPPKQRHPEKSSQKPPVKKENPPPKKENPPVKKEVAPAKKQVAPVKKEPNQTIKRNAPSQPKKETTLKRNAPQPPKETVRRPPQDVQKPKETEEDPKNTKRIRKITNFGSGNRVQKEKQFFENRIQRSSTPTSSVNRNSTASRQIAPDRFSRNYSGPQQSHKPYNYLLNDRKDPRSSFSGDNLPTRTSGGSNNRKQPSYNRSRPTYEATRKVAKSYEKPIGSSVRGVYPPYDDYNPYQYGNYISSGQENVLRDTKLKRTGRLQQLVH